MAKEDLIIVLENRPSSEAIRRAWWVIAKSITRRTGVVVEPVFKDDSEK
ncbi:hypothetical protein IGK38_001159 [Enterococcus pernyi]